MNRTYARGADFPNEGFVQLAIERHFFDLGFTLDTETHVDLLCTSPHTNETWHIEAKGKTAQIGLDFRTCLGQLVQRMDVEHARYGIAIPDLPAYRRQTAQLSGWVVEKLGLHWLFVSRDGTVEVVAPNKHGCVQALVGLGSVSCEGDTYDKALAEPSIGSARLS